MSLLVISLFLGLFFVGIVSSLDWSGADNYKTFIEEGDYGKIEVWDTATTILFQKDDRKLTSSVLNFNTDQCLINCESQPTITLYEEGTLIEDIRYLDKNGEEVYLEDSFSYVGEESYVTQIVDLENSKEICSRNLNGTDSCSWNYVYKNVTKTRQINVEYNLGDIVPTGTYDVTILATKEIGQSVDWQIKVKGEWHDAWAWWNSDWEKKRSITFSDISGNMNNLTRYIELIYDSDIQVDKDDIRFVNSSETGEISFDFDWINSTSAGVWLKIPILTTGENIIYMYYNNSEASAGNSSVDTFVEIRNVLHFDGVTNLGTTDAFASVGTVSYKPSPLFNSTGSVDADSSGWNSNSGDIQLQNKNYLMNSWATPDGTDLQGFMGFSQLGAYRDGCYFSTSLCGGGLRLCCGDSSAGWSGWISCGTVSSGQTVMVTIKHNATKTYCYLNGNLQSSYGGNTVSDTKQVRLGYREGEHRLHGNITDFQYYYDTSYGQNDNYIKELFQNSNSSSYSFGDEEEQEDITPPYFTDGTPTNQTISYGNVLNYNINATDETALDCFTINDSTNFKINCSGYLQNNTLLSAGLYNLNATINDTSNNLNSTLFWVNVTKIDPSPKMAISGTTPIEYGITSDFSESETNTGDGGCSYSMDRGDEVYGVDTWVFNYSTSGCVNYTAGSVTKDLVVNQNDSLVLGLTATTPIEYPTTTDFTESGCPAQLSCILNISNAIYQAGDISANYSTAGNNNYSATSTDFTITINQNSSYILSISGTTPIIYGTATDVVGSDCPSQLSCNLDKTNIIYGVEVSPVTFNYSTAGNTNYTAGSITKDITINQAGDTFDILLNDVLSNLTVTFPQQVNVSVSNNLTTANIDVNGTTFISGTNYTLGGGVWFVNVSTIGNVNYSSNESHWYITVNKAGDTFDVLLNGVANNLTITFPQQVNVSVSNNLTTATIDVNGTIFTSGNNYTLGGGVWFVNVSSEGNQNYTTNESYWYVTMDKATPIGTLAGTSPITYGTDGDVEGTESNSGDDDLLYRLHRGGTLVSNPDNDVLGVGTYNYIYNVTGGQNYSAVASLDTFALTVNIATGDGTLLLNGSATNYTINRTTNVNITATLDVGSGDISVYIDTTLFQTGSSPISDENQFNVLGWYLINFTYHGNENYTGFEKYLYVNVTANPLAVVNVIYPTTGIDYEAHFVELNYTVLYGINCWYNLGEGGGYVVVTCGDNVTGITSIEGSNIWTIKAENLDGFNTTDSVSFTVDLPIEYSTFTLRMVDVLKICIMIAGLFIIAMAGKAFYSGNITFGRLFTIGIVVSLGVGAVILLGPILINYISDLIH